MLGTVADTEQRTPKENSYIYPSAVFLLLILLVLARDFRPTLRVVLVSVGVMLVSLGPNLINLNTQARKVRALARVERAELERPGAVAKRGSSSLSLPVICRARTT